MNSLKFYILLFSYIGFSGYIFGSSPLNFDDVGLVNTVIEEHTLGDPFDVGIPGFNTSGSSSANAFSTMPANDGTVSVTDARSVVAAAGPGLRLTMWEPGSANGPTSVSYDMGTSIDQTTIANHILSCTEIIISDMDVGSTVGTDDPDSYYFEFSVTFLDGSMATSVSQLNITETEGDFNFAYLGSNLFSATLIPGTASGGGPDLFFKASSATAHIMAMDFTQMEPSFGADLIRIFGRRTLCEEPTLPVNLVNFSGKNKGLDNELTWVTESEINNEKFEIEYSTSKHKGFKKLGEVEGQGFSFTKTKYQFVHENAVRLGAETFYYRIKQIDLNGRHEFSEIIPITIKIGKIKPMVSPNPIALGNKIIFSEVHPDSQIQIYNTQGVLIEKFYTGKVTRFEISTHNFKAGPYIVSIGNRTETILIVN